MNDVTTEGEHGRDGDHGYPSPPPPPSAAEDDLERPSAPGWLPWALAVLGITVAVASIGLWVLGVPGGERDRQQAAAVASETVLVLTNWDAAELSEVRAQVDDLGTPRLQDEADAILGDFEEELAAAGAESDGEIIDLVAEADRGSALALVIARQELTVAEVGTTSEFCWAVRVTLTEEGGEWLADQLDLVGPGDCPAD